MSEETVVKPEAAEVAVKAEVVEPAEASAVTPADTAAVDEEPATETAAEGNGAAHAAVKEEVTTNGNGEAEPEVVADPGPTEEEIDAMTHTEFYTKLTGEVGMHKVAAYEVEKLVESGYLTEGDLDERALNALKEFDMKHVRDVLKEFASSDLSHVQNKSAYLCGMMKTYRQRLKAQQSGVDTTSQAGPDEAKLKEILDRTGYSLDVTTGQRKYGGPPPGWEGSAPGSGHEVFVGRIPRELFEDTLVPLFEKCGRIWDLRLMVDSLTGYNRGYAFCTFCDKEGAKAAVKQVDEYEVLPNKKLKVNISIANVRLFAGNIPKQRSKDEIKEEFAKVTEGLRDVIVYTNPGEPHKKNRGFAFLEYESHKLASAAKRKLSSGRCRVLGCDIIIDWADPQEEPDDDIMEKVKVLYVKGLMPDVTEDMLKEKFEPYGAIERCRKVKDYAFIHFTEREHCLQALNDLNGQKLGESTLEISLAKPQGDKLKERKKMREMMGRGGPPGGFRGGPRGGWGGPRGGYGGYGGYGGGYPGAGRSTVHTPPVVDYGGYGGGYDDGWGMGGGYGGYDGGYGYDDFGGRGGRGGYGRGGFRGGPRGGPMGGRGGFPPRGRSFQGPRGGGRGGPMGGRGGGGMKRPMDGQGASDSKKPRSLMEGSWEQPIAQQPLNPQQGADNQWYQDSW